MREEVMVIFSLLPAFLAGIALTIAYKKDRGIWIMGMLAAIAFGVLTSYGVYRIRAAQAEEIVLYENEPATQENYLDVAYELMADGKYRLAEKTLGDARNKFPYNDAYILASARLAALQGDDLAATALYALIPAQKTKNPYLTYNTAEANANDPEEQRQSVFDAVVSICEGLPDGLDDLLNSGFYSEEDLLSEKRTAGYFSVPVIREMQVREAAASGDYETFANSINDDSDAATLLIAAECSRNGRFDGIRPENREENDADDAVLRSWIRKQEKEHPYEGNDSQIINEILAQLEQTGADGSSDWVKTQIMSHIMNTQDREESKLYLELARMEFSEKNYDAAAGYLLDAVARAASSKDAVYAGAAQRLNYVIQHPEDLEARKEVDRCTQILVSRILYDAALEEDENELNDALAASRGEFLVYEDTEDDIPFGEIAEGDTAGEDYGSASAQTDFARYLSEEINQVEGGINILSLDKGGFPKLSAVVAADASVAPDAENFKNNFDLSDCSNIVEDYQVSKMDYQKVNICLICDNSGSMEGDKIENLKSALQTFADNLNGTDIRLYIVPFSSGVETDGLCDPSDSLEQRKEKIDKMEAGGGTDIAAGLEYGLNYFSSALEMNLAIIMSDGQDSFPGSYKQEEIRSTCREKGISIYTMGLGEDVDQQILHDYAELGNGSYMYVSDSQSLLSFYNKIYRICTNRYQITYTAPDTFSNQRSMVLEHKNYTAIRDEYLYSLYENENGELELDSKYQVNVGSVVINGLANRLFYKGRTAQVTQLLGEGFKEKDKVKLELSGTIKYDLESRFVDEHTIEVIIPSNIAVGIYNVVVTYNGAKRIFDKGLVMTADDRYIIRFGDYCFTATEKYVCDGALVLDGIVFMNDWLGFDGQVFLGGNVETDTQILLSYKKAYRQFRRESSEGLGKYYADRGLALVIPGVSDLKLYREELRDVSDEDYPVDVAYMNEQFFQFTDFIAVTGSGMSLYPDRMEVDFQAFDTMFPLQRTLMRISGLDDFFKFKIEDEEKIIVNEKNVGCKLDLKLGTDDKAYGALGNMHIFFRKANVKLKLDTIKGDIDFGMGVDLAMLSDGLGIDLSWKEWKIDGLKISADHEIETCIANIPVTFSDFKLGVEELSKNTDYGLAGQIFKAKWYGAADISAAKISTVFPGLEKWVKNDWVDDAAVVKLDDTKLSFSLLLPYVGVETKVNVLGILDIGEAKIELGHGIKYTNPLIGFEEEKINGMLASLTVGPKIETSNCKIRVQGTGELALSDKVFGARGIGDVNISLSWWILVADFNTHGEAFIGIYKQHNGEWQFAVLSGSSSTGWDSMTPVVWKPGSSAEHV